MNDITDSHYKPDLELLDRYTHFSSELLRISLLGLTAIAALLVLKINKDSTLILQEAAKSWALAAIIAWCLSSACSLLHRYFAADSMAWHIAYLRTDNALVKKQRNRLLKRAARVLLAAGLTFGAGVFAFAIAVVVQFF